MWESATLSERSTAVRKINKAINKLDLNDLNEDARKFRKTGSCFESNEIIIIGIYSLVNLIPRVKKGTR
jgi:hypothetical protein